METALRDQFACGLSDLKCQHELLTVYDLTLQSAIQKVTAVELAKGRAEEFIVMQQSKQQVNLGVTLLWQIRSPANSSKLSNAKIGHLTSACYSKQSAELQNKVEAPIGSV